MNSWEYKQFYDTVGKINGWDFSSIQCVSEEAEWDFYTEVSRRCRKSDILLDIGTGGGEAVLTIADAALLLIGMDQSAAMIETATRNVTETNIPNVRFLHMDADKLDFPPHFFNIVSCRHSGFSAKEIAKVLVKDGIFLTQQVGEKDKLNLKEAFGRGQAYGAKGRTLLQQYITELSQAGFTDIQAFESNVNEYYQTAEDFIFLLKHTPIIPNFGRSQLDFQVLEHFIKDNLTEQGIQTNSDRFMIVAKR